MAGRLEADARALLDRGDPDGALALLDGADESIRRGDAWRRTRARVRDAVRLADGALGVRPRLESLADLGQLSAVQSLVDRLPAGQGLDDELALAKRRAKAVDTLDVTGFDPGLIELSGRRTTLRGVVSNARGQAALNAADTVLALARQLGVSGLPEPLAIEVQKREDQPLAPAEARVVTVVRLDEEQGAFVARVRWHAASWTVARAVSPQAPAWIRLGLVHLLAGSEPVSGGKPQLTPVAQAWRRLFVTRPPHGDGAALLELLAHDDPDPIQSWALTSFACFGSAPSLTTLESAVHEAAGGGQPRITLTPPAAAELERAWLGWQETP